MFDTTPDPSTLDTTVSTPMAYYGYTKRTANRRWSEDDRLRLTAYAVKGYTQREAARKLGRTERAVSLKASAWGISFLRLRRAAR